MSAITSAFLDELTPAQLAELAEKLKPYLKAAPVDDGWLNAAQAAKHLACSRGRLYDLVQLGKLEPCRDGRRLLFRRSDLDAYLERVQ